MLCVGYMAENLFDIMPCSLCYYQRYVMMGIIATSLGVVISGIDHKIITGTICLLAFGGVILCGYHIGIELKWWSMPQSCIGNIDLVSSDPGEMLKNLQEHMKNQKISRCDQINWYLFGVPASWWTLGAFLFTTMIISWREWTQK